MTIAVYGRHTLAGAKQIVFDEGINIAPRYKSARERLIEISLHWQAQQDAQREREQEAERLANLPKRVSVKPCVARKAIAKYEDGVQATAIAIMRKRSMPEWARKIVVETAKARDVSLLDLIGSARSRRIVAARNECFYLMKMDRRKPSYPRISKWFAKDHTAILWGAAKHALVSDLPAPGNCDIEKNMARKRKAAIENHRRRKCS